MLMQKESVPGTRHSVALAATIADDVGPLELQSVFGMFGRVKDVEIVVIHGKRSAKISYESR